MICLMNQRIKRAILSRRSNGMRERESEIAQHISPLLFITFLQFYIFFFSFRNEIENAEVENCILRQESAFNSSFSIRTAAAKSFSLAL